jgi:hypothetical protein
MKTVELIEFLKTFVDKPDAEAAYQAGRDCGKNGANTTNCHFTIFSSKENTRAWERGKADAERERV